MIETREQWLNACVESIVRPALEAEGYSLPKYRATCGFPSVNALSRKKKRLGECWYPSASRDDTSEILITPLVDDVLTVAGILAHECVHAAVGHDAGHRAPFVKCGRLIGLEGKPTSMGAGDVFKQRYGDQLEALGPYPHKALDPDERPVKKQTTRLIKVECGNCGYVARVARKWIDEVGPPHCPDHGEMDVAD